MKELIYPKGWSWAVTDNALTKKNPLKFQLDRTLYIKAGTFKEGGASGGIIRFIEGVRKGFTIDDILDGKYDGIVDSDPRNKITNKTTALPLVIEREHVPTTIDEFAKCHNKSKSTVYRMLQTNEVIVTDDGFYIYNPNIKK